MTRPLRATAVLLLAMLCFVGFSPASAGGGAGTSSERRLHSLVNGARANKGLAALDLRANLTRKAHRHSRHMANRGLLSHQPSSAFPAGEYGENVAQARGIRQAHRKLMGSTSHRKNLLCGCYDRIGVGVVRRNGWYWITQMFVG